MNMDKMEKTSDSDNTEKIADLDNTEREEVYKEPNKVRSQVVGICRSSPAPRNPPRGFRR